MSTTVKVVLAVVAVIIIAVLAVWLISRNGDATPADPLAGTKWQVRSYANPSAGGVIALPLAGTQLTVEFTGGQIAGSSGCNSYSGNYSVSGSSLTIGPLVSTRKACAEPPGVMEQETSFLAALQSATGFEMATRVLQLLDSQGHTVVDLIPYTEAPTAVAPVASAAPTETPPPAAPTATDTPSATPSPVPGAPVITRFTTDPTGQVTLGQCVALAWEVQGSIDSVVLTANNKVLMSPAPVVGNTSDCPNRAQPVTYVLEATGPGGTSRLAQTVNVVEAATETPVPPTATPEAPVISSFTVNPGQVNLGECFTIGWNASGSVTGSRLVRGNTVINDNAGLNGQQQDCPEVVSNYTYALQLQGAGGQQVTQQQGVTVVEAPVQNPLAGTSWQVKSLSDPVTPSIGVVLPGTTLTMDFGADGSLTGSSGCNTYTSTYVVTGSQLAITAPVVTRLLCTEPAGIMEQETAFLSLLQSVGAYTINGNNLTLQTGAGKTLIQASAG